LRFHHRALNSKSSTYRSSFCFGTCFVQQLASITVLPRECKGARADFYTCGPHTKKIAEARLLHRYKKFSKLREALDTRLECRLFLVENVWLYQVLEPCTQHSRHSYGNYRGIVEVCVSEYGTCFSEARCIFHFAQRFFCESNRWTITAQEVLVYSTRLPHGISFRGYQTLKALKMRQTLRMNSS